jgi:hypothetical protein
MAKNRVSQTNDIDIMVSISEISSISWRSSHLATKILFQYKLDLLELISYRYYTKGPFNVEAATCKSIKDRNN